jgi:hypothetical protein
MKRFQMRAYSGSWIELGFWGRLIFDIAGISHHTRLPALREHVRDRAVGVIDRLAKTSKELTASGYFLDTPDGAECKSLIEQGYPMQCSIALFPETVEELGKNDSALVNGAMVQGPGLIFRTSHLGEISFCTLGADFGTSVGIAASASLPGATKEWQENPALRAEFNHNFDAYVAYCKAVEAGQVNICIGRVIKG